MKSSLTVAVALSAVLFAAGCASTDAPADPNAPPPSQREYRTGSNIPVRDKSATQLTPEEKEKQAQQARDTLDQMRQRPVVR